MKSVIVFNFLLMNAIYPTQAEITSINKLLDQGKIALTLTANGGHQGKCIKIRAKNTSDQFISTKLEAGRILHSANASQQDLLLVEDVIIALSPGQSIEKNGSAFCHKRSLASPEQASSYLIGPMGDEYTTQLAMYINKHEELDLADAQAAVWMLSDCHPLSAISMESLPSLALRDFVSSLMQIPEPWYSGTFQRKAQGLYSDKMIHLYGDIDFQLSAYETLTVVVEDEKGKIMKTLVNEAKYGPGDYDLPVRIWVENWFKGIYKVKVSGEENTIITAQFEI